MAPRVDFNLWKCNLTFQMLSVIFAFKRLIWKELVWSGNAVKFQFQRSADVLQISWLRLWLEILKLHAYVLREKMFRIFGHK